MQEANKTGFGDKHKSKQSILQEEKKIVQSSQKIYVPIYCGRTERDMNSFLLLHFLVLIKKATRPLCLGAKFGLCNRLWEMERSFAWSSHVLLPKALQWTMSCLNRLRM
jgi:hypothetical protein